MTTTDEEIMQAANRIAMDITWLETGSNQPHSGITPIAQKAALNAILFERSRTRIFVSRNEEAGFTEAVWYEVPYAVRQNGAVETLYDMNDRDRIVGVRWYDDVDARTQAIAAAAWVAGRDAGADWHDEKAAKVMLSSEFLSRYPIARRHKDSALSIRKLTPPAEFAAPEDKPHEIEDGATRLRRLCQEVGIIQPNDPRDAEITRLRAQLTERDALLREARAAFWGLRAHEKVCARIDALLSKTEGE